MGRVPRWSSRVALTLLLTGFLLCSRLASLFVLVFPCVGIARICRECKGWTWGNFPLSKRQETGSRHATCHIATCRPPFISLAASMEQAWRHAPLVTSRIQARYNGDLGRDIPKKRGRYCTSVPGRKTTAQDVRRIQAIFRRGDVDKKKEKNDPRKSPSKG